MNEENLWWWLINKFMYKFTGLNIDHFIGDELAGVTIFPHTLSLQFESDNIITILSKWSIIDQNNSTIDSGDAEKHNSSMKIHRLLQSKIENYSIVEPEELHIKFSNGLSLVLYDDSDQYESCSFSPNIYI